MSDEEQEPRASIADLRSRFEALAADQKGGSSSGRPVVPKKPLAFSTGSGAQSSSTPSSILASRSGTPTPFQRSQTSGVKDISRRTSSASIIPSISLSETDAPGPVKLSGEEAVYEPKGWITSSPITLSPILPAVDLEPAEDHDAASATASVPDEKSTTSEKLSVADLRSRFGATTATNQESGGFLGVTQTSFYRPPSRPSSPLPRQASDSTPKPEDDAGPIPVLATGPQRKTPPPVRTRSPSPGIEVKAQASPPLAVKAKAPPPPIPPKSRNATISVQVPVDDVQSSDSGHAQVADKESGLSAALLESGNSDQQATLPPPLPSRSALPDREHVPPKLPDRARSVAAPEAPNAVDLPHLPPRQVAGATLRPGDNLAPAVFRDRASSVSNPLNIAGDQDYQPPPPPSRHATPVGSPQMPSRVKKQNSQDANSSDPGDEDDEGEEPHGLRTTMSTSAKRALDEYPDSSRAHRRAPDFVPRQFITNHHNIHAYTVCGHRLCIASHKLKVYDLTLGDAQPIVTFDPKSLGIESRSKEHKLTAVSFRALSAGMEEGRYIWCGTNLGHLVEVDITTGEATQVRLGIHGSMITHIFRYREYMLSLEENGKMHVFGPFGDPATDEATKNMTPWRTIRTAEKTNFVRMLGDQVWTASGPLTRSTTNPALRGPTIRVYEPLGVGTANTSGRTTYTSEWTGAVTAAAILTSTAHEVYLAHEGGFVSIFDRETLACKSVLKVSSSDILALEGVGDRLWAGYRTGMVNVYDVTTTPWTTTNMWLAHP
jgi:hypothetical protein